MSTLEWEPEARAMPGRFRLSAARYPDDPDISAVECSHAVLQVADHPDQTLVTYSLTQPIAPGVLS